MINKIILEIVHHSLEYIVERMGIILKKCAFSPNIRDRADLSCLICDKDGKIIVQAEHIPVHLGSMYLGMKKFLEYLRRECIEVKKGDIFIVNDPYIIGTHLNDVTILKPVFYNDKLIAWIVNKAHHVDIGGAYPGGLSINAKTLYEEGLVIPPLKIYEEGRLRKDILNMILNNVRLPKYTYGDLFAQISACNIGEDELVKLIEKYGITKFEECCNFLIKKSEYLTRKEVERFSGIFEGEDYIEYRDKLLKIKVQIQFVKGDVIVDFSGSSEQVNCPLNAVFGVTIASTTYVFKTLLSPEIIINDGFYRVIHVYAPEGTIVNPIKPAPVGLGNVETSQRIVDALYNALKEVFPDKIPAQSGGTMTNVILSGLESNWVFYETIGCGCGARPGMNGENAVHVYMTNTMNTPIEVIEKTYPIIFTRYEIRRGSGGLGKWKGGDGIIRAFKVLEKTKLSIIMDRVKICPKGREGGQNGKCGKVTIIKKTGEIIELSGKDEIILEPGDEVIIETPGGGGFGKPE